MSQKSEDELRRLLQIRCERILTTLKTRHQKDIHYDSVGSTRKRGLSSLQDDHDDDEDEESDEGSMLSEHHKKKILYRKINGNMREMVSNYQKRMETSTPAELAQMAVGSARANLDVEEMKAAFTLRENRVHDQSSILNKTLKTLRAKSGKESIYNPMNREKLKKTVENLKEMMTESVESLVQSPRRTVVAAPSEKEEEERRKLNEERARWREREALLEQAEAIKRAQERERQRELALQREEELRREEEEAEVARKALQDASPQETLHRFIKPIFAQLWDMEFASLDGVNPFRIIIDRDTCAAMGVPDYCDVIVKPMNLTYIRDKVDHKEYFTLKAFFEDVELMIQNALIYNSDPNNVYHLAAKEMRSKFKKMARDVLIKVQQGG